MKYIAWAVIHLAVWGLILLAAAGIAERVSDVKSTMYKDKTTARLCRLIMRLATSRRSFTPDFVDHVIVVDDCSRDGYVGSSVSMRRFSIAHPNKTAVIMAADRE